MHNNNTDWTPLGLASAIITNSFSLFKKHLYQQPTLSEGYSQLCSNIWGPDTVERILQLYSSTKEKKKCLPSSTKHQRTQVRWELRTSNFMPRMREVQLDSPLTHIKDEEAEWAKNYGSNLFPVHRKTVSFSLVLGKKSNKRIHYSNKLLSMAISSSNSVSSSNTPSVFCCLDKKKKLDTMRCSPQKMIQKESSMA